MYGQGGVDACFGDSGGPLAGGMNNGQYILGGIVSWGNLCEDNKWPGVYTKVSDYMAWIRRTTGVNFAS